MVSTAHSSANARKAQSGILVDGNDNGSEHAEEDEFAASLLADVLHARGSFSRAGMVLACDRTFLRRNKVPGAFVALFFLFFVLKGALSKPSDCITWSFRRMFASRAASYFDAMLYQRSIIRFPGGILEASCQFENL